MKRLLITGGAGMIGRRVTAAWVRAGGEAAVFDDLSSGLPMPAAATLSLRGDIRDGEALSRLCRDFRPQAIMHLAAVHHIPTCEQRRRHCLEVNVAGTEQVLQVAEEAGVRRVVLASSGAVYAWSDGALGEQASALDACDNYALSKLSNERQLRFWCERGAGVGRVARIFNSIAHDDPNGHLIPEVLAQLGASGGAEAEVRLGNLSPRRDYLHADDVAQGLLALLGDSRAEQPYDVFNLCTGVEHSVEQLVAEIGRALGRQVRIRVDDSRRRRVDRPSQLGDPSRAAALLGWRAQLDFPSAIRRVLSPA